MEKKTVTRPTIDQLEKELERRNHNKTYRRTIRSTVWILIVVSATVIICANFFFSVLRVQGYSMTPTMEDGELVVVVHTGTFKAGEIAAFYYNNRILLKRVVGSAGDWVDMDEEGNVYINEELLDEPYISEKSLGECDIEFPYQVPEGQYFTLGDHRNVSMDSRSSSIGTISAEQMIGRVIFRIWPVQNLGSLMEA